MRTLPLIGLLLCLAMAVPATAASITASDNAFVRKNQATTDQDETEQLMIKSNGTNSYSRIGYLRFDTSGLTVNATDTVTLDINVEAIGTGNSNTLNVWSLNNGVSGETTWNSGLTWNTRPDGTGNVPTASLTALTSYGYTSTGNVRISVPASTFQTLLANDTNNEVTLVLSNNSSHNTAQTRFSALGNTGGYLEPTLRVDPLGPGTTLESGYGGELTRMSGSTFSFNQSGTTARAGEGGSGNNQRYNHMMLFQLPEQPTGGFLPEDTSFALTIDHKNNSPNQHADLWAVGYVPAADIGDVGANLNNGSITDIDDFFLTGTNSETKDGWNIGTDNTVKVWDNMAGLYSTGRLISAAGTDAALTDFINDLYDSHGASAGDYLVLRANTDADMNNYSRWWFNTGSAASNQPTLTLTVAAPPGVIPEPATMCALGLAVAGLGGYVRKRRHG